MSTYDEEEKIWHGPQFPYQYAMNVSLGDILLEKLMQNPDRILQICADDETTLSCEQLRLASIRIAQLLQKIGIQEDDAIGLITHHSHFATCLVTGCMLVGAIVNPLDGHMSESDIHHVYNESKPKLIICDDEAIPKLQNALQTVDFKYQICSTTKGTTNFDIQSQNFLTPTSNECNFILPKFSKPSDQKCLAILCSSGTTGMPKSVCLTHAAAIDTCSLYSSISNLSKSVCFSPLYSVTGFHANLTIGFSQNETRILTERKFSVDTFIEIVEAHQITHVTMAPYVLNTLMNYQKFLSSNNECLQNYIVGGAVLSKESRKKFDFLLPKRSLTILYGMTEQGATVSKPFEYRQGISVGSFILPNVSIKIIDDDGNAIDNGKTGEICLNSKLKFLGYHNNPEATKQLLDKDGFIKTGDIGYFDDDGMLFVVDRKKDILKYQGIHVNPSEIENVIESIDGIHAASVVGIPDELCDYLITAAVVKREGFEKLTENEIINYVASKLPDNKHLRGGVYFFKVFPTTISDKIMKISILEEILKQKKNIQNF